MLFKPMLYEIEFEIRDKNNNIIESTHGEIAKQQFGKEGPLLITPELLRLPILKKFLADAKEGDSIEQEVPPEEAYGNKERALIKKVSTSIIEGGDRLQPGLYVRFGDIIGKVISVSPGRATIDFNHPYAGKPVVVKAKVLKIYKEPKEMLDKIKEYYELKVNYELDGDSLKVEGEDKDKFLELLKLYKINLKVVE